MKVAEIDGKTVRKILEYSVNVYPDTFAGFLQVSGIKFTFDSRKIFGSRVSDIYIDNQPLDDEKIYTVATSDFLLEGGDGYEWLNKLLVIGQFGTCEEVLSDYLEEVGTKNLETGRIILK